MTVYELMQQLAQFPADEVVSINVFAEQIDPLNTYDDESIDLDHFEYEADINFVSRNCGNGMKCCLDVELK